MTNQAPINDNGSPAELTPEYDHSSAIDGLLDRYQHLLEQHRSDNPDLYRLVDLKKKTSVPTDKPEADPNNNTEEINAPAITNNSTDIDVLLLTQPLRGAPLREKMQESHREIRQRVLANYADIIPRTQANNRKCAYESLEEEQESRADLVSAQIQSWRSLLPNLIRRFAKIPDYRCAGHIKHKMTVLMVFGLFAFIFRLTSRQEMALCYNPLVLSYLMPFPAVKLSGK